MTKEELKYALMVESLICLNCIVSLDNLVVNTNHIFLEDQERLTPSVKD